MEATANKKREGKCVNQEGRECKILKKYKVDIFTSFFSFLSIFRGGMNGFHRKKEEEEEPKQIRRCVRNPRKEDGKRKIRKRHKRYGTMDLTPTFQKCNS